MGQHHQRLIIFHRGQQPRRYFFEQLPADCRLQVLISSGVLTTLSWIASGEDSRTSFDFALPFLGAR